MLKHLSFTTTALAAALAIGTAPRGVAAQAAGAAAAPKFAYINSQQILERAPGRAEAESTFTREMNGYHAQVQRMGDSLNTLMADFEKAQGAMTAVAREAKQKDLRTRQEAYQTRVRQLEQQAQQRQYELVQPMMDQIRKVLEEVRAERGYAMIFDVAAQGGAVVAADKSLDITDQIVSRLKPIAAAPRPDVGNAAKPAGAARPTPTGVTRKPQ